MYEYICVCIHSPFSQKKKKNIYLKYVAKEKNVIQHTGYVRRASAKQIISTSTKFGVTFVVERNP